MSAPQRIQRKRMKGWTMPEGAIYVGRPTQWGNPFVPKGSWIVWTAVALGFNGDEAGRRSAALALYRLWLTGTLERNTAKKRWCGAMTYDSGRTVETSDHVEGIAGFMSMSMPMPKIPDTKPDLSALRGKDLACFCPLDQPCHADLLLELANV